MNSGPRTNAPLAPRQDWLGLQGRTAVVTGAAGGLGEAMVRAFVKAGAHVVLCDTAGERLEDLEAHMRSEGGSCFAVRVDVRDAAAVEAMVRQTEDRFGGVDVLVNNAGIFPSRPWHEVSLEEWDDVFAVNLRGYFACARAVYASMRNRGWGRIVNVSSSTFFLGFPRLIHYVATKGGIVGLTRALAREVGADGITVNAVAPGAFPTAAEAIHADAVAYSRYVIENQAIKRRGRPEELADAVLFLASAAAAFITGQTLVVDGGWAMH